MDLKAAIAEADRIVADVSRSANAVLERDDFKDAKRLLTAAQQELRDLKRQVTEAERDMRADFTAKRQQVSGAGQIAGMFTSAKTRGAMSRGRATVKRSMAQQQQSNVDGYRKVKEYIDGLVADISRNKRMIDDEVAETKATPASPRPAAGSSPAPLPPDLAPPPPAVPAQWAPDPRGRHELRYWDGGKWTEHVVSGDQQGVDPV